MIQEAKVFFFARIRIVLILGIMSSLLPATVLDAQVNPPGPTYEQCQGITSEDLRAEISTTVNTQFEAANSNLDVKLLIDQHWQLLGVDRVLDRQVDIAVEQVHSQEGYWNRFLSGWSGAKAEELTTKVATIAFGSDVFKLKLDELSSAVAGSVADEISLVTTSSTELALNCIQGFIGERYSVTMLAIFQQEIQPEVTSQAVQPDALDVSPTAFDTHGKAIAGVSAIIASQLAKKLIAKVAGRIASKVAGRIVGSAAASLIPVAGWVIGGGLIIWDLIEGGDGALPQIRESLKDEGVKETIRSEINDIVSSEIENELDVLAISVANETYSIWDQFWTRYTRVLTLAEQTANFKSILENTTPEQIGKLGNLVAISELKLSQEELNQIILNGIFERIFNLPEESFEILRDTGDPNSVVAWATLAGESIKLVAELELHKVVDSESFADREELEAVLKLDDSALMYKLLALNKPQQLSLLSLQTEQLEKALSSFDSDDLGWIGSCLQELSPQEGTQLISEGLGDISVLRKLRFENNCKLPKALGPGPVIWPPIASWQQIIADLQMVREGAIPWQLFWGKYSFVRIATFVFLGLLIVGVFWLFIRRRNPSINVVVNVPSPKNPND